MRRFTCRRQPLVEPSPARVEDVRVEIAAVVDDDRAAARPGASAAAAFASTAAIAVDVGRERRPARPGRGRADLELAPVVEAEQLVRVAVLLVVVDQPGYGGEVTTPSNGPSRSSTSRASPCSTVASRPRVAHAREGLDPRERVERVAAEEVRGPLDRAAGAPVLVAPVRLGLRRRAGSRGRSAASAGPSGPRARARRAARRRARSSADQRRGRRAARRPPAARTSRDVAIAPRPSPAARQRVERAAQASRRSLLEREQVVARRLDAHQQAVERRDVDADRVAHRTRAPGRASSPSRRTGRGRGRPARRSGRGAPRRAAGRTCRGTGAGGGRASSARARAARARTTRARGRSRRRAHPASATPSFRSAAPSQVLASRSGGPPPRRTRGGA